MDNNPLVFSSSQGRICPNCQKPIKACVCKKKNDTLTGSNQAVRIFLDRKGRGGKVVTRIEGLSFTIEMLKSFTREIKQKSGTGGAVKGSAIEIQGDVRDEVITMLSQKGIKAKKAGG